MPTPIRIAAVYAHPDDGEFFAAGSLAKWARQGHKVYAICATNGDLGTKVRGVDAASLGRARGAELAAAMQVVGGEPPVLLGLPDGFVREHAAALKERLVYWLRKLEIDRVVTFDPWKRYEIHPDHIEVGRMASEAACFSCFPLLYPAHIEEGLRAAQPSEVWYMGPTEHRPNRVVDIRDTFEIKVRSVLCHGSQIEMLAGWFVPGADPTKLTDEQRSMLDGGARMFLDGMARGVANLAPSASPPSDSRRGLRRDQPGSAPVPRVEQGEAFFAQRVGPGHFENYQEMFMEMAGAAPSPPEVS